MIAEKAVLFIAYHYPPRGGVAVLRTVKFIKYLCRFGWRPSVVTLSTRNYLVKDETLIQEVPASVEVVRVRDPGPRISRTFQTLTRNKTKRPIGFPDREAWWVPMATTAAVRQVVRHQIPLIYTTSPPHSTHLVGAMCKRITGARWVADFRDTWVDNPYFVETTGCRKAWKERLERIVVDQADVVLANTPVALRAFTERYPEHVEKFVWLPNGYDPDDFADCSDQRPAPHALTLMYVGSMGGTRPLRYFLTALARLIDQKVPGAERIEVVLVGPIPGAAKRRVEDMGLTGQVRFTGHLPHAEAVRRMHDSDVLLLLQFAEHGGSTALPSKVFEYMKARKRILAMTCEGPTADLVRDYPGGFVTAPDDVASIQSVLRHLLELHQRGELASVDYPDIDRFSREALTRRLEELMTELSPAHGGARRIQIASDESMGSRA